MNKPEVSKAILAPGIKNIYRILKYLQGQICFSHMIHTLEIEISPGPLKWQEGYQARPWTCKKHLKHVFSWLNLTLHPKTSIWAFVFAILNNDIFSPPT